MLNSTGHDISTANKNSNVDDVFIKLIRAKMPIIVGILTFMSMINSIIN